MAVRRGRIEVWLAIGLGVLGAAWAGYQAWYRLERNWSDPKITATCASGTKLVELLEAFRESKGRYPAGLDELGEEIARPAAGLGEWVYRSTEVDFELRVNGSPSGYPSIRWDREKRKWIVDM